MRLSLSRRVLAAAVILPALFAARLAAQAAVSPSPAPAPRGAPTQGGPIGPAEAKLLLERNPKAVLLDVRTQEEYAEGHIAGAKLLPYDLVTAETIRKVAPDPAAPLVVYCRSGRRSAIAAQTLAKLGYRLVYDLGGLNTWPYGLVRGKD